MQSINTYGYSSAPPVERSWSLRRRQGRVHRFGAPNHEAPDLMSFDVCGCFFHRQPDTAEELEHAIQAVLVSCRDAGQYGGNDARVVASFRGLRGDRCLGKPDRVAEVWER